MKKIFVDTFYWIEITRPDSDWAEPIKKATAYSRKYLWVTTDEVFTEFMNGLSPFGPFMRDKAVKVVNAMMERANLQVVPQTRDSFRQGLAFYAARSDKDYSLVDCISMNTMHSQNIDEVLTNDHHFEQAGFQILLKK